MGSMGSNKVSNVTRLRAEVGADLDRSAAEALHLEILRLANRYGLAIESSRISRVPVGADDPVAHPNLRPAELKRKTLRSRRS